MKRNSVPRELRRAYDAALTQGWAVSRTGGGHLRWRPPAGAAIITSGTIGQGRATQNTVAMLRRAGLQLGR